MALNKAKTAMALNKAKVIRRPAYGYRDSHYFFVKIKPAFSANP